MCLWFSEDTKKINNLKKEIESILNISALEVDINQKKIAIHKESLEKIVNDTLTKDNKIISKKLSDMGLSNSSNALGTTIALVKQQADMRVDNVLKIHDYAEQLKKSILEGKHRILDVLIQERDKSRQLRFKYTKVVFSSTVVITFSHEIKQLIKYVFHLMF
jgi:hypothetical protein